MKKYNQPLLIIVVIVKTVILFFYYIRNPTKQVCLEAVKQDGNSIRYIKNPSEDICLEAVKENYKVIKYIKKDNQSFDIVEEFFNGYKNDKNKYSYAFFEYLSKKFITKDQAMFMIQEDPNSINLVSKKLQDEIIEIKPELDKYLKKRNTNNFNNNYNNNNDYFELNIIYKSK